LLTIKIALLLPYFPLLASNTGSRNLNEALNQHVNTSINLSSSKIQQSNGPLTLSQIMTADSAFESTYSLGFFPWIKLGLYIFHN